MPKVIGICRYCHEERKLCDAHIVPHSFLGNCVEKGYLVASTEVSYTERSRIGPYDQKILCAACDQSIGLYDAYAKRLLLDEIEQYKHPTHPYYFIPKADVDYETLKKFFISLLWRASITDHPVFQQVSLRVYDDLALQMLKGELPLQDAVFSVLIFKDSPSLKYSDVISCVRTKLASVWVYKFHFSGYQITIVPNSRHMYWVDADKEFLPTNFFLKSGDDFIVLELDTDISGKDKLLSRYRSSARG